MSTDSAQTSYASGELETLVEAGAWHVLELETIGDKATGALNGKALFTNTAIRGSLSLSLSIYISITVSLLSRSLSLSFSLARSRSRYLCPFSLSAKHSALTLQPAASTLALLLLG